MRTLLASSASLLIHFLILVTCWKWAGVTTTVHDLAVFPLEVLAHPTGKSSGNGGRGRAKISASMRDLMPTPLELTGDGNRSVRIGRTHAETEHPSLGDGSSFEKSARGIVVLEPLRNLINQSLEFPVEFVEAKIDGEVTATLKFDRSGIFLKKESLFKSPSPFLSIYVRRLIEKILSDKAEWTPPKEFRPLKIICTFSFVLETRPIFFQTRIEPQGVFRQNRTGINSGDVDSSTVHGNGLHFVRAHNTLPWYMGSLPGESAPVIQLNVLPLLETAINTIRNGFLPERKGDKLEKYRSDPSWGID